MTPRCPRTRPVLGALLVLLLGPAGTARAGKDKTAEKAAEVSVTVDSITSSVESLERQVAPGRGFITQADAIQRYEDCVYLHMIGENEAAAEGFFSLVTLGALTDAGLHRDAEWYLAESLYAMGNTSTAEARYRVIADDDQHPFRDDAVRRLLELYATTGQTEQFDAFYKKEIVEGRVKPTDLITYSLAKSFYHRKDYDQSVSYFDKIGKDSPYWARAQYFLGTIDVVQHHLDKALPFFQQAVDTGVKTTDDRKVHDLALLAIARIHYERGELDKAAEYYGQVSGDSPYLEDKLYEVIWTYIKQKQYRAALDGVEIFLLRFPDSKYTAQLRLIEAHLQLDQKQFDSALTAYQKVVSDYTPVKERFATLAKSDEEPKQYFKQILAEADGNKDDLHGNVLPPYAVAMMVDDPGMSRALSIFRELDQQEKEIAASEALIAELRKVMDQASGIGGYDRLRYDVSVEQGKATDTQLSLLQLEETWLAEHLPQSRMSELTPAQTMRKDLEVMVSQIPADEGAEQAAEARRKHLDTLTKLEAQVTQLKGDAATLRQSLDAQAAAVQQGQEPKLTPEEELTARTKLESVQKELDGVVAQLDDARAKGPDTSWSDKLATQEASVAASVDEARKAYLPLRQGLEDPDGDLEKIDREQTTLASDQKRLASLREKLVSAESTELTRVRARFEHEVKEVASQREALAEATSEADDVSVALTKAGFGRLEDFFAQSVLRADMGIVDVYWSQKVDVADQRERMATEKAALLSDLEKRFKLIREKLGQ